MMDPTVADPAEEPGAAPEPNPDGPWASTVVIHVRAGRPAPAALAAAVALAQALEIDVRGHYVEDEALLALAALPCAREVSFAGGRSGVISTARLQSDMTQASMTLRRDLARLAAEAGVPVQCDVVRADPDAALDATCAAGTIIALTEPFDLAQARALPRLLSAGQAAGVLLCGPHATETEGPLIVLLSAMAGLNGIMEVASSLQGEDGRELAVLTLGTDSDETAQLTSAARIATGYDRSVPITAVEARRGPGMIADTARRMGAGLVVAKWQETSAIDLAGLVAALDCPLLLVR
jgi:hypothetical protein